MAVTSFWGWQNTICAAVPDLAAAAARLQVNDALNTVNKALGRKITTLYIQPDVLKTYTRTFVVRVQHCARIPLCSPCPVCSLCPVCSASEKCPLPPR
jgi:hypothetical protein